MSDTGRLKFNNYNGLLYVDAYLNGEFTINDLEDILREIRKNYSPPTDVIFEKSGSYSVASEVQTTMHKGIQELGNLVYVVLDEKKKKFAEFASSTFMSPYKPQIASSVEHAYTMLSTSKITQN